MDTLTIEDLKYLIDAIEADILDSFTEKRIESLKRSKGIIEQMIKDLEFEQKKEL